MRGIKFRYYKYKLPNGRSVFLTNRPDVVDTDKSDITNFINKEKPTIRFQFTDDWVNYNGGVPMQWYLWVPGKGPTIESIYSALVSMDNYNKRTFTNRAMWLHCDSSSMRAPTFFGLFLNAFYPDKVKEICDTIEMSESRDHWSKPDEYAEVEFKMNPKTKLLIELLQKDPKEAYAFLMGYGEYARYFTKE